MSLFDDMGIEFCAKGGTRWWPTRPIPWLGFVVDASRGEVAMEEEKVARALGMRHLFFSLHSG